MSSSEDATTIEGQRLLLEELQEEVEQLRVEIRALRSAAAPSMTAKQLRELDRLRGRWSAGIFPMTLSDIPDGSLFVYALSKIHGGAAYFTILEPEPTNRYSVDMGTS